MDQTEKQDLNAIASGDMNAFERIFFQYQPRLVYFLSGLTHDMEVSRDIAQDIFISLWENREKLYDIRSFSPYLFRIARYKVYDYFDHLSVTEKYSTDYLIEASTYCSEEELIFVRELQSIINHAVSQMSPQRQKVYKMSREEGIANDEIAQKLGISKRTVENHLVSALSILRKIIYIYFLTAPFQ